MPSIPLLSIAPRMSFPYTLGFLHASLAFRLHARRCTARAARSADVRQRRTT